MIVPHSNRLAIFCLAGWFLMGPVPHGPLAGAADRKPSARLAISPPHPANRRDAPSDRVTPAPAVVFNQSLLEGYAFEEIDLNDTNTVFELVFDRLPKRVTVYPSENYYYFILSIKGRQVWGNFCLPANRRDRGILSFAYAEFEEYPTQSPANATRWKDYAAADGLRLIRRDASTYAARYRGKEVTFHLHRLRQEPPKRFALRSEEVFVMRTLDESGLPFFLLFNQDRNYFFWVLNDEEPVSEYFTRLDDDVLLGRRTGFAFWREHSRGDRKVLAMVRRFSLERNDYYDGPFDQLADNDVDQTRVAQFIERAIPRAKGRIDKYGYFTDTERPSRIALACYGAYAAADDIIEFVKAARRAPDPCQFISQTGILRQQYTEPITGLTGQPSPARATSAPDRVQSR